MFTFELPRCLFAGQVEEPWRIPERCKPALVGHGTAAVSIAFPESASITQTRGVLIYNRGTKDGTTTLLARTVLSEPVPATIFATVEIKRVLGSRYGGQARVTIPKIAGEGAIVFFNLTIGRRYLYKERRRSVLTYSCPVIGRVLMSATATFADASTEEVLRPGGCSRR